MAADTDVILVDLDDREIGTEEKLEAHRKGLLHRAFSIFLIDGVPIHRGGKMLLQRRAEGKYHSGGLWTNACCSHQRPDVTLEESVHDRLMAELGTDCPLAEQFSFVYRTAFPNGLAEYEYDHVFLGTYPEDGPLNPDPEEISECRWVTIPELKDDLLHHPEQYTSWFIIAAPALIRRLEDQENFIKEEN